MTIGTEPDFESLFDGASGTDDENGLLETSSAPYDPYENELIGQFLMALGYLAGKEKVDVLAVGLLQQTPRDGTYGDLLLGCGSYHAIEFKRARPRNGFKSEERKWDLRSLGACVQKNWLSTVDRGHWLVWGSANRENVLYAAYMRCVIREWARADNECAADNLLKLIIADHAKMRSGVKPAPAVAGFRTATDLDAYLRDIGRYRVANDSGSSGGVGMSYLGVGIHSDHGLVMFSAETLSLELERRSTPHADLPLVPSPLPPAEGPSSDHGPAF